ncbi:dihydroorotate dehydrogenase (quinone) [Helicobacter monodelphidis]|uniref:quinone-dependent dihydroorotate dehydrogenase n=1 Tax=Helicobacter sp. 15-1451 TaxID=2004995 RepID=UPI000DCDC9B0|nr:quinone-dependent dihydroorotate dehydrogenase [Helicobacter sp. 15-1451]RAX57396.1 dihydroorotate dehydrogenase (quinone) [Helicobacter sp. 15-1451]
MLNYTFWQNLLFKLDAEKAHDLTIRLAKLLGFCPFSLSFLAKKYAFFDSRLELNIAGLPFSSPVGLAAGFDKNGEALELLTSLGFSHLEIGTITPKPQEGNPHPRLFRLKEDKSIQNAMGFNNKGQEVIAKKLDSYTPFIVPLGINIGKNKTTANEQSLNDYESLLRKLSPYASYITINLSSPNTPNLRDLQNEEFITELFSLAKTITQKPIFLKIAPDMSIDTALELTEKAIAEGASGIIATNTTTDYSLSSSAKDFGGISGQLLKQKSFEMLQSLGKAFYSQTILISVGGIDSAQEAYKRIKKGASLVQIYTSLIYEGPRLIYSIKEGLVECLEKDGFSHITEAIGADIQ